MRHFASHGSHYLVVILVCLAAARPLARAEWTARAPRLGIVVWQAWLLSLWSALIGLFLASALAPYRTGELAGLLALTFDPDRATRMGTPQWISLAVAAVLALALLTAVSGHAVTVTLARRRHLRAVDLVSGEDLHGWRVVDHPAAMAYCVPGRRGLLVISTGALGMLRPSELAAVTAHELAHAAERHDVVLLPFAALAKARMPLSGAALEAVALLVEMRADDRAAAVAGPVALRRALLHFGRHGAIGVPSGALGAAGRLRARIHRLRHPAGPLTPPVVALIAVVVATVATTPLSLLLYPW